MFVQISFHHYICSTQCGLATLPALSGCTWPAQPWAADQRQGADELQPHPKLTELELFPQGAACN